MKRLLLICLLIILPLQFSYAAVSCHCSNEQPVNSEKNQTATSNTDTNGKTDPASNGARNCGCPGHCHVIGSIIFQTHTSPLILNETSLVLINNDEFYQSYISNDFERPNWWLAV